MAEKQKYFAFQIYDGEDGAEIGVDSDPAALWTRFAEELEIANESGGIETIEVGQVLAANVEDAIEEVRAERYLKDGYAIANGVGYVPDQP